MTGHILTQDPFDRPWPPVVGRAATSRTKHPYSQRGRTMNRRESLSTLRTLWRILTYSERRVARRAIQNRERARQIADRIALADFLATNRPGTRVSADETGR
jgi:hypothetical protein